VRELLDEYDRQKAGNPCRSARAVCASVEFPERWTPMCSTSSGSLWSSPNLDRKKIRARLTAAEAEVQKLRRQLDEAEDA